MSEIPEFLIDNLTGLPGQNFTLDMEQEAIKQEKEIFMFDIDNFKAVNSVFSYEEANEVLRDLGKIVQEHFADGNYGRKGGEEFLVVLDSHDVSQVKSFIDRVARELKIEGQPVTISGGLGAGQDPTNPKKSMAEVCLTQSKANGRNQFTDFDGKLFNQNKGFAVPDSDKKYVGEFSLKEGKDRLKCVAQIYEQNPEILSTQEIEQIKEMAAKLEKAYEKVQIEKHTPQKQKEPQTMIEPGDVKDIHDIREYSEQIGVHLSDEGLEKMQGKIEDNSYTPRDIVRYLDEIKARSVQKEYEEKIFKDAKMEISDVKDEPTLLAYAKQLEINLTDEQKSKMSAAIRAGKTSPSKLAEFLEGVSYERFLQSRDVPHLSEARHQNLKTELGEKKYSEYINDIEKITKNTGLTENTIDALAQQYFKNKAAGLSKYLETVKEINLDNMEMTSRSISLEAKRLGIRITEEKADVLLDNKFNKEDIKAFLLDQSLSEYREDRRNFISRIENHQKNMSKEKNEIGMEF